MAVQKRGDFSRDFLNFKNCKFKAGMKNEGYKVYCTPKMLVGFSDNKAQISKEIVNYQALCFLVTNHLITGFLLFEVPISYL